jgi:hypothetical protein
VVLRGRARGQGREARRREEGTAPVVHNLKILIKISSGILPPGPLAKQP